ncbi:phosphopantetheinyl transferase [Nemania sp. FL0916]|nr:phosphopantetheinyl transferase [Nemania sp. FL0916]
MASSQVEVIQYLVDTRNLWPAATQTGDLETEASRALALLTQDERTKVLKYYFVADAKMALTSHLLKHWVVSKSCGVRWRETKLSADANGKPVFKDSEGRQPVVFNVSHQAGLVALVAATNAGGDCSGIQIGVDVVCVNERQTRDHRMIRAEGWPRFVDMHADVFGRSEATYLKTGVDGRPAYLALRSEDEKRDWKLRAFYTLWCLREAYVKMTGEALLAAWLGDLEFRAFEPPNPGAEFMQSEDDEGRGMVVREFDVVFHGKKVEDANICIRSLGTDYMTCTAVRTPQRKEDALGWHLGPFEFLAFEEIVALGEATA